MNSQVSLRGQRALILHPEDHSRRNLVTALEKLDIESSVAWPEIIQDMKPFQVVFFDIDQGHDEQFAWKTGCSPVPLIALVGSEAPGRIEWAMSHDASAYLLKPIQSAGVYSALTIAFHRYTKQRQQAEHIQNLTMRLQARPLVLKVVLDEMLNNNINDDDAFRLIRSKSMQCQMSVEEYCAHQLNCSTAVSAHPRIREQ